MKPEGTKGYIGFRSLMQLDNHELLVKNVLNRTDVCPQLQFCNNYDCEGKVSRLVSIMDYFAGVV